MYKIFHLSALLLLEVTCYNHAIRKRAPLFNGNDVKINSVPYFVQLHRLPSLYYDELFNDTDWTVPETFCGGAILSSTWILTAAHCLHEKNKTNLLVLSDSDRREFGELHPVEDVIQHQNFTRANLKNDIGLIKLSKPIEFKKTTQQPIKVRSKPVKTATRLKTIGMGLTKYQGNLSQVLQYIEQPVVDFKLCEEKYATNVSTALQAESICLGEVEQHHAWLKDSGGPVVYFSRETQSDQLVGLVSSGPAYLTCPDCPDVNVDVTKYQDWIKNKTNLTDIFVDAD